MGLLAKRKKNDGIIDVFGGFDTFPSLFDAFRGFDSIFGAMTRLDDWAGNFNTELIENKENFVLTAEIPGVKKEDIDIQFDNGLLTIACERNSCEEKEGDKTHWRERSYGKFSRSCRINNVDPERINANLEEGVLTVTLGKKETTSPPAPKQIEITSK